MHTSVQGRVLKHGKSRKVINKPKKKNEDSSSKTRDKKHARKDTTLPVLPKEQQKTASGNAGRFLFDADFLGQTKN